MNELAIMKHAKLYLDKMGAGVDPLTDSPVPETDLIRNERIAKCLKYVSGILQQVIDNKGIVGEVDKSMLKPFSLTDEEIARFEFSDVPIPITEIARRIDALNEDPMKAQFKYRSITNFLVRDGLLQTENREGRGKANRPTGKGLDMGILIENRESAQGPYTAVLYSITAQRYIIQNLPEIIRWQ